MRMQNCRTTWFLAVRQPRASAFCQWGLTQPHPGLCALKRSTWCVECPGGSERPWPRPGGHVRCSALTCGCPQHWNSSVKRSRKVLWRLISRNMSTSLSNIDIFTCRALCPPSGNGHGKPPNGHSKLVLGWRQTGCSAHTCGTAGRWGLAAHLKRSGCHPRAHGNEMACWFPVRSNCVW